MDVSFKTRKPCSTVTLPMTLILSCILPKLPAKSLLRFKCVSKSFLTEISSPEFNALFSEANHRLLILRGGRRGSFSIYELDSLQSPPMLCPYPVPLQWLDTTMSMVACCESYLLIGCGYTDLEGLILVNPTTRVYRVLPKFYVPTHRDYAHYGMCHCLDDEFNEDFKVARFVQYHYGVDDVLVREIIVYSLNTNLWKLVEREPTTPESCDTPVLVQNHLLVMIFETHGRLTRIGCFDIKSELWSNDVLLPAILLCEIESNATIECMEDYYHLGVLDGCLRFTCYDMNKSTYSIWVMKDFGVKESWVKLMSLPAQGPQYVCHPIAYRKGSLHELLCIPNYDGKYEWYNLREEQFTETGFDSEGLNSAWLSFAYICKESLLNFPGGLLIRSLSKEREVDDEDDEYDWYDDGYLYKHAEWFYF